MEEKKLRELLRQFKEGAKSETEILLSLKNLPFENISFAHIDHHRSLRQGWPETIFCQGKTTEQILKISAHILKNGSKLLATRISEEAAEKLLSEHKNLRYNELARTVSSELQKDEPLKDAMVALLSAGTSDIPVAEEAAETLQSVGIPVEKIYDVGVAGIHRLFDKLEKLQSADYIIVVAGMEGALASVVGGLVGVPMVAVPTSIGYGSSLNGIAALLSMLNSCAAGISVVNIDNGFGAACAVARHIFHSEKKRHQS